METRVYYKNKERRCCDVYTYSRRWKSEDNESLILEALQQMDDPEYKYTKALGRILNESWDADDADIVVQTACFGEVVYG